MFRLTAAAVGTFLVLGVYSPALGIVVDSADDVCAPTDDPCIINQELDVVTGSTLDFGTRAVELVIGGTVDTGNGEATILCGSFTANVGTNVAFRIRGSNGQGSIDGGTLTLEASRRCTLDDSRPCVTASNCDFGTCSSSVCSLDMARTCVSDENCDFGTCDTDNRCTGNANRACEDDSDCQFGECSIDVCSGNRGRTCGSDADCDFGECTVGSGVIDINGNVRGDGATPGSIFIRGAGDVALKQLVTVAASNVDNDGGVLEIQSGTGTVTITGSLTATSGGNGTGGEICILSGQDTVVNNSIDASGGDFDGGFVEIDADRDVILNQSLRANSTNGGGFGGEVIVFAGRDVVATTPATIEASGHRSAIDNFGGDGGALEVVSENAVTINAAVALTANGADPDGFGGEILIEPSADLLFAGTAQAKAFGTQGAGGSIDADVGGAMTFPAGALIDVVGASNGGGTASIFTGAGMTFGGTIDGRTNSGGAADSVSIDVNGDVQMTGTIHLDGIAVGQSNGRVDFEACRLTMNSGAIITNTGGFGQNFIRGRERITIDSGASITADPSTGSNRLIYRDPNKPPIINGTVSPAAPPDDINEFLVGCPVCGNGELDGGETCEDGNTEDGDGCSSDCQDERCIAQTPGYPGVPLCDDGDGCTLDTCNTDTGSCENVFSCDDGIDCTVDECSSQNQCLHSPSNAACDDDNPCTTDSCNVPSRGCINTNNVDPCDDGLTCTINDRCSQAECRGTDNCPEGEICNPITDMCQVDADLCGDGIVGGTEECDDADTDWQIGEFCNATCMIVDCGDPDDSGQVRASDALFVLRAAVGVATCEPCVCNVDSSAGTNPITASDSLRVLRASVGTAVELICPACP